MGRLQLRQPPVRMLGRRQRIGSRRSRQFRLPAQEVAQNAIDQAAKLAVRHFPGCRNGLIDHGMHRIGARFHPIDGDQQQGAHLIDRQRLVEQAGEEEIAPAVGAQAAIDEILHGRPGDGFNPAEQTVGQALPGKHGGIDAGRLPQGIGE